MESSVNTLDADLLVFGAGMAGMTAAGYAASRGARVVVIEKNAEIGGTALLSNGLLWTAPSLELFLKHCPNGDARLGELLVSRFLTTVDWVRSTGIELSGLLDVVYGKGYRIDILRYLRRCQAMVESSNGWVLRSKMSQGLLVENGGVVGAVVRDETGPIKILTPATLLATGGFQANAYLLHRVFGDNASQLLLRSNYCSAGDGLQLAVAAGASLAGDMTTFYGHLIAWPLPEFLPKDFVRFALRYSDEGVLVNLNCERFTDESLGDHQNAQAVAKQPHGRALLLLDDQLRRTKAVAPRVQGQEAIDTVEEARMAGAHVARCNTLAALADAVTVWGYDARHLSVTIDGYNNMTKGLRDASPVPRQWNQRVFGTGPYHAIEVRAGITFTEGGLRIDEQARVSDESGKAIPGLYAAGADTGGIFNGGYAGGLALACVFGLTAVETMMGPMLFDK